MRPAWKPQPNVAPGCRKGMRFAVQPRSLMGDSPLTSMPRLTMDSSSNALGDGYEISGRFLIKLSELLSHAESKWGRVTMKVEVFPSTDQKSRAMLELRPSPDGPAIVFTSRKRR